MANARSQNVFYIDTQYSTGTDELAVKNLKVYYIIVTTTTSTPGTLTLTDSGTTKITIKINSASTTQVIDLRHHPILFSTSIRPTTLTNCVATVVIEESRG